MDFSFDNSIDIRQIKAFVALVNGGSLKHAAMELSVTESAVSHSIRNLELSLNTKLLERKGKHLKLTHGGELFMSEAVIILRKMRNLRSRLQIIDSKPSNALRIAIGTSFVICLLPEIIAEFRECHPNVNLAIYPADHNICMSRLASDQADAAITISVDPHSDNLSFCKLFSDELELVMARNHPLAIQQGIPLHVLFRLPVLVLKNKGFSTSLLERAAASRAFSLKNIIEVHNQEALRQMLRMGMGISFQAPWAFKEGREDPALVWSAIPSLNLRRDWFFVFAGDEVVSKYLSTFQRICCHSAARMHFRHSKLLEPCLMVG